MSGQATMKPPVFSPVDAPSLLLAFLSLAGGSATRRSLATRWRAWLNADRLQMAESVLVDAGHSVSCEGRLVATVDGLDVLRQRFGQFSSRQKLFVTVLPALALGLEPDGMAARRLNRAPILQALVLSARYGLPVDPVKVTLPHVMRMLLTLDAPNDAEGFAVSGGSMFADAHTVAGLRRALLDHALMLGDATRATIRSTPVLDARAEPASSTPPAVEVPNGLAVPVEEFADRVRSVMVGMPPGVLSDSLPVSVVFDAYITAFPGDLTIDLFKSQLLASRRQGKLALRQLDRPEALPEEVRNRSEIVGRRHRFHLILRD